MGVLGDILDQLSNLTNLSTILGTGKSTLKYPVALEGNKNVTRSDITNIPDYDNKSWQSSLGYAFSVVRVLPSGIIDDKFKDFQEFRLQINPQELSQDEIFAIEVTPTLRGVIVEHHGTVLKDINISGTTGISPNRSSGGVNPKTGQPRLQNGTSGFEEFHELRSYFRTYVESKRVDQRAGGELRMVFKNYKDREFLFVEPQKFSMKRSASRPFLYDYAISLKAVGVVGNIPKSVNEGLGLINDIDNAISTVNEALDTATGIINGAVGIIARVERSISDIILNPLRKISLALQAIAGGQAQLLGPYGITRRFVDSLNAELKRVSDNLADAFGVPMSEYNSVAGRISTLSAAVGRTPTYQESQVLNAFRKAQGALSLLATQPLFDQDVFTTNAAAVTTYSGGISIAKPNSVKPVTILADDNIQTIASRELGDIDQFRDIILLNNLKSPYISATGGPGILKPGDTILLPSQTSTVSTGVKQNKIYNIQRELSELERALGVDMQLTRDGDIQISNIGDAALIGGIPNVGQAIATKLLLELGSLKRHPGIGTALSLGSKVTTNFLSDLQSQILNSLRQDPRIESIPFIQLNQQGGTTTINMLVKVAKIAQPIPIPLSLNTG